MGVYHHRYVMPHQDRPPEAASSGNHPVGDGVYIRKVPSPQQLAEAMKRAEAAIAQARLLKRRPNESDDLADVRPHAGRPGSFFTLTPSG